MGILQVDHFRYQALLGAGGIGSGEFFLLQGNHTLGREESRSGHFLDRQDYCKLHIICDYVKILLGDSFQTFPIGKVGDDEAGGRLYQEMKEARHHMQYVERVSGRKTLFSFCFLYPDGSGGNMTSDDSAASMVDPACVAGAKQTFSSFRSRAIALAVAEVPLEARAELLKLGTEYDFYRIASFTSGEIKDALGLGLLDYTDLLAINVDEAAAAAGISSGGREAKITAERAIAALSAKHPQLNISITAGAAGSWSWNGKTVTHDPIVSVRVESTAGSGDAHLSGIIAGLAAGLSLCEAQQLGTLLAAASVTSPHTINRCISRKMLLMPAERKISLSPSVLKLLQG